MTLEIHKGGQSSPREPTMQGEQIALLAKRGFLIRRGSGQTDHAAGFEIDIDFVVARARREAGHRAHRAK